MKFPFGKYSHLEVKRIIKDDLNYCIFISKQKNIRKHHPNFHKYLVNLISKAKTSKENSDIMPFGKYRGMKLSEMVLISKSYNQWLIEKTTFFSEYPETYKNFMSLHNAICQQSKATIIFYILIFHDQDFIKVGKTKQYFPKRLYNYVVCDRIYENYNIDIKKSIVFKTNDLEIERKVLNEFKEFAWLNPREALFLDKDYIIDFIRSQKKENQQHFYLKKPVFDFIPYKTGKDMREDFVMHTDKYHDFKGIYERHLNMKFKPYNPFFLGEHQS